MQEKQDHTFFLKMTVDEAFNGMREGEGGPFGAVITSNGKVIGRGHNTVLASSDPTAHAEVNAIRNACKHLRSHQLSGAVIYSNFEPCPMCLAAIYWSGIRSLFYCNNRSDAERIGFMDNFLYRELTLDQDQREIKTSQRRLPEMEMLIEEWMGMEGKKFY